MSSNLLLGFDVGSSSIKASVLDAADGSVVASAVSPSTEMGISSPQPGWAEQHPDLWWKHMGRVTARLQELLGDRMKSLAAIGISYQMHGLVIVDAEMQVLRPSIIWCDSRAVDIGERAFRDIGETRCLERLLNSPGNFTASKLRWVRENEPHIYARVHRAMLPGDYLAACLTGEITTTPSGLSEGTLWDFQDDAAATMLLEHYDIDPALLPPLTPTFSEQGRVCAAAAREIGVPEGVRVTYRAGDQPNNAFSLKVLEPGEAAATAGTSGVVYGVIDRPGCDPQSRINTFVHVNHRKETPRYGVLLCINGTGILNSWIHHNLLGKTAESYERMNEMAAEVDPGSDGLLILPFGNGAERTLGNRDPGASIHGLRFPRHDIRHIMRAAQEGIVFSLAHGLQIMRSAGLDLSTVRAGMANMFLSPVFTQAFATVTGAAVELYNTDGAQGAARGAGLGAGLYPDAHGAFVGLRALARVEPDDSRRSAYADAYAGWREVLDRVESSSDS